jgi:hypothetical protein
MSTQKDCKTPLQESTYTSYLKDGLHYLVALILGEVEGRKTALNLFQYGHFEGIGRVMFPQKGGADLVRPLLDLIQKRLKLSIKAPTGCNPKFERFEGFVRFHSLNWFNNTVKILDSELAWKIGDFGVGILAVFSRGS